MVEKQCAGGLVAVQNEAIYLNGIYQPKFNTTVEPYSGPWVLIGRNGRAIDSEFGGPQLYETLQDAMDDAEVLAEIGEYSTC